MTEKMKPGKIENRKKNKASEAENPRTWHLVPCSRRENSPFLGSKGERESYSVVHKAVPSHSSKKIGDLESAQQACFRANIHCIPQKILNVTARSHLEEDPNV